MTIPLDDGVFRKRKLGDMPTLGLRASGIRGLKAGCRWMSSSVALAPCTIALLLSPLFSELALRPGRGEPNV